MSEAAKSLATSGGSKLKSAVDLFRSTMIPPRPGADTAIKELPKEEAPKRSEPVKLEVVPAAAPKASPPAPATETSSKSNPTLPRASRTLKSDTSARKDMSLKRATFFFRKQQILDLKRLRLKVLEMTGDEIDISDLVQEGVDLLLKKYNSTIRGETLGTDETSVR
jgi:hypothetical protein